MWDDNKDEIQGEGREVVDSEATEVTDDVTEAVTDDATEGIADEVVEEVNEDVVSEDIKEDTQGSNVNNTFYSQAGRNNTNPNFTVKNDVGKESNFKVYIAISCVLAVLFLGISAAVVAINWNGATGSSSVESVLNGKETQKETIGTANTSDTKTSGSVVVSDVSGVVENAMPSVVAITSKTLVESDDYMNDIYDYYFGGGSGSDHSRKSEQTAAGSGFIVDQTNNELLIVTNNHVVEGADSLSVMFYGDDSKKGVDGYIKGTDATKDIAVVAVKVKDVKNSILKNIKKVNLGDSKTVKVGEGVIAIGNALGYGQSVTTGIISAVDREVTFENRTMKLLQTDAAINGGNSGGALLNAKGEVIGINVAKYSSNASTSASIEGMGFAIPISSVKDVIGNLETRKTREKVSEDQRGFLGITGNTVSEQDVQMKNMPKGVYVVNVYKGGPAQKAGIAAMNIITKIEGEGIDSMEALQDKLKYFKAGEKIKVTIVYVDDNQYKSKDVSVTLTKKNSLKETEKIDNFFDED